MSDRGLIRFHSGSPPDEGWFALWSPDPAYSNRSGFIDIRAILAQRQEAWLQDLERGHADLSALALSTGSQWWLDPASRLDARPWGNEGLFKPLFFALCLLDWTESHPDWGCIHVIDAPAEVGAYLSEIAPRLAIEGAGEAPTTPPSLVARMRKGFRDCQRILVRHVAQPKGPDLPVVALLEVSGGALRETPNYFYRDLFSQKSPSELGFMVLSPARCRSEAAPTLAADGKKILHLLNTAPITAALVGWIRDIRHFLVLRRVAAEAPGTAIGGRLVPTLWRRMLYRVLSGPTLVNTLAAQISLDRLLTTAPASARLIIYPYEEKGIERGMLATAHRHNRRCLAYTPHPQHRLTLALRDLPDDRPRPDAYAVCGPAYVPQLAQWAKKPVETIRVWGSAKAPQPRTMSGVGRKPRLLVLFSHPNEARLLHRWLKAAPQLMEIADFVIRGYAAGGGFDEVFFSLRRDFPHLLEMGGRLEENIANTDLSIFCATSAGLVAISEGHMAIHAQLDDFFSMDPCFGDLQPMLTCSSPWELEKRLAWIINADDGILHDVYTRQRETVYNLFSVIDRHAIDESLQ